MICKANYPEQAILWHCDSIGITGSNLRIKHECDAMCRTYTYQNPAANGDTFRQSFILQAGTYLFEVLGYEDCDSGKIDWYIDDVLMISGQDWFNLSADFTYKSVEVRITNSGEHILKGVVNGKNYFSLGYNIKLVKVKFK